MDDFVDILATFFWIGLIIAAVILFVLYVLMEF